MIPAHLLDLYLWTAIFAPLVGLTAGAFIPLLKGARQ